MNEGLYVDMSLQDLRKCKEIVRDLHLGRILFCVGLVELLNMPVCIYVN